MGELAVFSVCALILGWLIFRCAEEVEWGEWLLMMILFCVCLVAGGLVIAWRAGL